MRPSFTEKMQTDLYIIKNKSRINDFQLSDRENLRKKKNKINIKSRMAGNLSGESSSGDFVSSGNNLADSVSAIREKKNDSMKQLINQVKKTNSDIKDSINNIVKKKEKDGSKWDWGIVSETGFSFINSKIPAQAYSPGTTASGSVNDPQYTVSGASYTSPKFSSGFSFMIGAFINKTIFKHVDLSLGISYKLLSNKVNIGARLNNITSFSTLYDTLGSADVYNPGASMVNIYYHFIELPIQIQWQLNRNKKIPVYWMSGITFSDLISTNSLLFDNSRDIYYRKKSAFNHFEIGVSCGLLFGINEKNNSQIKIGPMIDYSLTPMAKSGLYAVKHYNFVGIHVQKNLAKK